MKGKLKNFSLRFPNDLKSYYPLMIGGMGVDISTDRLALQACRLGAIGHISDAMVTTVTDKYFKTDFVKSKFNKYKENKFLPTKGIVQFDLHELAKATKTYVEKTMSQKKGEGLIFINCMEKLTMNNPLETLKVRLISAMEAGIDGITMSAGLHLSSFSLIQDHPLFRKVKLGIIVSSLRALKIFLQKIAKTNRMPDYVIIEGPLAGGHLGFGLDWKKYSLLDIFREIKDFVTQNNLDFPLIPAGGIFTGTEAVEYIKEGAAGVQVSTRFTISQECGLPDRVKQDYAKAELDDIQVSMLSPTGYPMRILKNSPGLTQYIRPNCEMYGFLLDKNGFCAYLEEFNEALDKVNGDMSKVVVKEKVCLCTHMKNYKIWTCGHNTYKLKDTTYKMPDGNYFLPSAEHIINDYLESEDYAIKKPQAE